MDVVEITSNHTYLHLAEAGDGKCLRDMKDISRQQKEFYIQHRYLQKKT